MPNDAANALNFYFSPVHPDEYDWSVLYPENKELKKVQFLDVGCGYGGLLVTLSTMFPDNLMLGLEIRVKVSDYVNDRIKALRIQYPGQYQNAAVLRTNAMKYLPNFFYKGQKTDPIVEKLYESTEEGQKVTRNNGEKYLAVYRRIAPSEIK
ncbi:tRNA (guanine-N(7)-)-methyltransferase [Operophtera brumata]|uniref:tRNA (guanine(46)-N(7))-methyltransferase n=1 Tax=Operophtera brumata TaxID=104452 RepID=A0A0L7LGF2_OPEBR|nr:tRNA (guanine-N(7)-)-methyltransferase [Operophtera brumata]